MSYGTTELPYTAARIKGIIKATGQITVKPAGLAGIQLDCNGATGDFTASITPANLTGNRRWILPNRDDTFAGLGAQTFTGAQTVSNQLAVGASASTFSQLVIGSTGGISGTVQIALYAPFTGTSSATAAIRGAQFSISTPATAMTCAEVTGFTCANNVAGAGSTITRSQGFVVSPQNAGTNNCAILHDFSAAYSGNWFIRDEGTYPSRFGGAVTLSDATASTSTTTGALVVTGGVGIGGRLNVGGAVQVAVTGATLGVSAQARIDAPNSNFGPALALVADSVGRGINLYSAGYINGTSGDALTVQTVSGGAQINTTTAGAGASGTLTLVASTASTSTTTGALVVTGGVGIGGRLNVGGALEVNSATLIKSNTTLTDGAAAAVGTLTNAPTAGNPTKWVLINDNGTIRKFPTWT